MAIMKETDVPEVKDAAETVRNFSTDEAIQHEALNREMFLHDMATLIAEGEARGEAKGKAEDITSMYRKGETPEHIAYLLDLDISFVEEVIRRHRG